MGVINNTSKYTKYERESIKSLVAALTIKRIPDVEIIKEIEKQTNSTFTRFGLYQVKQQIKKDSYQWYNTLRQDQYAYIHEYKERIDEILSLQQKHYEIIKSNEHNPQIQQTSLAELHKLSITYLEKWKMIQSVRSWIVIIPILYTAKGHMIDIEIVSVSILGIQR